MVTLIEVQRQASQTSCKSMYKTYQDNAKGTQAVHEVVTAYRAAQRRGTAHTKTRAEVSGTGKKPWRQKGTGRARVGSRRNPSWRGGGVAHGPRMRDYTKKVGKKTRRLAPPCCLPPI